jgi:hypothetical protein
MNPFTPEEAKHLAAEMRRCADRIDAGDLAGAMGDFLQILMPVMGNVAKRAALSVEEVATTLDGVFGTIFSGIFPPPEESSPETLCRHCKKRRDEHCGCGSVCMAGDAECPGFAPMVN